MRCWRIMRKINCLEKASNEVLERIREKRTILSNILAQKKSQLDIL